MTQLNESDITHNLAVQLGWDVLSTVCISTTHNDSAHTYTHMHVCLPARNQGTGCSSHLHMHLRCAGAAPGPAHVPCCGPPRRLNTHTAACEHAQTHTHMTTPTEEQSALCCVWQSPDLLCQVFVCCETEGFGERHMHAHTHARTHRCIHRYCTNASAKGLRVAGVEGHRLNESLHVHVDDSLQLLARVTVPRVFVSVALQAILGAATDRSSSRSDTTHTLNICPHTLQSSSEGVYVTLCMSLPAEALAAQTPMHKW